MNCTHYIVFLKLNSFKNCIKQMEMNLKQFPVIVPNVHELFCVALYTDYLSKLHKMFQIGLTYDKNEEYEIWNFCCS